MTPPNNLYFDWRLRRLATVLRDGNAGPPPEKLLQAIWQHQRLRRETLQTSDGTSLRILHPGFKSAEAGPDFRNAVIQFGDSPPQSGDIEIDVAPGGWQAHGHDRNPDFKKVILHVVWEHAVGKETPLPSLAIRQSIDAPVAELELWLHSEPAGFWPELARGRCCAPLRELSPDRTADLLQQAALTRLNAKASGFQARARQVGWEQSLWEGLFRALGYKQNVWPMQRIGELRLELIAGAERSPLALQARLLGVAGLLPDELPRSRTAANAYLRRVWDLWWRERDRFADVALPRSLWRFNGLRPANHPQRRLALTAHWLSTAGLVGKLEELMLETSASSATARLVSLLKVLQESDDDFWTRHWTLRSRFLEKPQPLLGEKRVTDLAINVILPWFWARANEGGNQQLRIEMEQTYLNWPAAEDNATLKLARQRLLGGAGRGMPKTAAAQQGLLQVLRDFCDHSNAVCERCSFPDLVRAWAVSV